MKLQLDPRIKPAIMQIAAVMKCPTIKESNTHIEHIVDKCNDTFVQLQWYLSYGVSKDHIDYSNNLLKKPKPRKLKFMLTNKELKAEYNDAQYINILKKMNLIFPFFIEFDFGKIMQIDNDLCVLEILPYLLTAFYLNSNRLRKRAVRESIEDAFSNDPGTNVSGCFAAGAYYRDVDDFCQLFSYQSFLPNLFKCGRTDCKTTLGRITDIDSFRKYIEKASTPIDDDDRKRPPMKLYYSQIYKVFIYSIIASACAEEFPNNPGIDYKASWDLFSDHTDSFAAASVALAGKVSYLSEPNADFLQALILCRTSLQSMGVDEKQVEPVQKILDQIGTAMPLDEIKKTLQEGDISNQSVCRSFTYLFRTYFSPAVYLPFQYPRIIDNLLDKERLAYIVMHPRQKSSGGTKTS